jgi:hypothetical protein
VGVRAANEFCTARKQNRHMHPVNVMGASGLVFECVKRADELIADERAAIKRTAQPWQFTPSPQNRARCVELRDRRNELGKADKNTDVLADLVNIEKEEDSLKCWTKP